MALIPPTVRWFVPPSPEEQERFDAEAPVRCAELDAALRVLFAFDPRRMAILLLGGNKSGKWNAWYEWAVPLADDLYDVYLQELRDEGLI